MEELGISFTAIVVATIAAVVLSTLWYMPLFGKAWAKEHGFDTNAEQDANFKSQMIRGILFNIIGNFFMCYVLAHNNAAWSFVPGMAEMSTTAKALQAGIFTWLGFYLPTHLGATVWEKKSWKLFFIDAGHNLISLIMVALILMNW